MDDLDFRVTLSLLSVLGDLEVKIELELPSASFGFEQTPKFPTANRKCKI